MACWHGCCGARSVTRPRGWTKRRVEKATLKPPVLKKQARPLATPSVTTWDATERSVRVKVAMPADAAKVHELAVLLDGVEGNNTRDLMSASHQSLDQMQHGCSAFSPG